MLLVDEFDGIHSGKRSALMIIVQALGTQLTGLDPEIRWILLYESTYRIYANWQHYIHNIVHQVLISLNDTQNFSFNR